MKTYIMVHVYSNREFGDCSLNGITNQPDLDLFVEVDGGNYTEDDVKYENARVLVQNPRSPSGYQCFVEDTDDKRWRMAGGNFVYSCDSRFSEKYKAPVPVHDRIESY